MMPCPSLLPLRNITYMQGGEGGSSKCFGASALLQPGFHQDKDVVGRLARRRSPKPDYFRADSNLSMDSLNKYCMSTYYVLGTTVGADFKVS